VEIAIEDDGPGIPTENLERVFERFYTARPGHEEFGKNSGLGLNISRQGDVDSHIAPSG
jgi:two-component system sensor histidine kinase ChvG